MIDDPPKLIKHTLVEAYIRIRKGQRNSGIK